MEKHLAFLWPVSTVEGKEKCGFTGAISTNKGYLLTFFNFYVDVLKSKSPIGIRVTKIFCFQYYHFFTSDYENAPCIIEHDDYKTKVKRSKQKFGSFYWPFFIKYYQLSIITS